MIIVHFGEYVKGGVATYLKEIISYQCSCSSVEKVILFKSKKGSEKIEINSPKFVEISYEYTRSIRGIYNILSLYKKVMNFHPDVIHLHSSFAGLFRINLFFKKCKAKVIYCSHGWAFLIHKKASLKQLVKNKIYLWIEKLLAQKTDVIINISRNEQQASEKRGFPVQKLCLIKNTVTLSLNYNTVDDPFKSADSIKLVFIGRFTEQKGLDILLKSFGLFNKNIELMIIGNSENEDIFRKKREKFSSSRIHFMGWIKNTEIDSYLRLADALIIPSRWEGFGLVALEGMRNKLAIIAASIPTLADIVEENKTGVLFEPENSYSLAKIVNNLDHVNLKKMGMAGERKLIEEYNPNDMNHAIMSTYLK